MTRFVLVLKCPDRKGIVAAVGSTIAELGGNIIESGQYTDTEKETFFMRVCMDLELASSKQSFIDRFTLVARDYRMDWHLHDLSHKPRVLIMVSQLGHCLNDLLYRHSVKQLPMELVAIVSNHEAFSERSRLEGVPFFYMPVTPENKVEQEKSLVALIEDLGVELVVLARYMQILSDDLSRMLSGRVINIHHSFLPSFKGARPYHQAHKRGVKLIGATAHYVTADLDEGPIIEQDVRRVDHAETPDDMVAIGRDVECQVLARAIKLHLEHRILLNDDRTVIFH